MKGNAEIMQALDDVAPETVGVRHDLEHPGDLHAFEGQPPRHDQTDVARAEDGHSPSRQVAEQVDELLRQAAVMTPAGGCLGCVWRAGAFARAHGEHGGARGNDPDPAAPDISFTCLLRSISSTYVSLTTSMSCSSTCSRNRCAYSGP